MKNVNSLPYYPRFIFNCSDGKCLSTGDLDSFDFIKQSGTDSKISSFVPDQKVDITWTDLGVKTYIVSKIEIHQIKYDLDKPTFGINSNDCTCIQGIEKKWLMEIYVFLNAVNK